MEYRKLGNSDLRVSAFSLGSWLTYEFMQEADSLAVIGRALEAGINFLDDARYDDRTGKAPLKSGYSEVIFGQLIRKGGWKRSDLIIANKLWLEFFPQQSLEEELNGSLERLQMDYLDLAYCATPPASLPLVDLLGQLDNLIKSGKLRHWGVLNWPVEQLAQAHQIATAQGLSTPVAAQLAYSLLSKSEVEDRQAADFFAANGIGIVASYSLQGGLLTGKYNRDTAALNTRFKPEEVENMRQKGLLQKVERVIEVAQSLGCTPAQLALAYCLTNRQVASVLFGARKVSQVEDNLRALEILPRLNSEILRKLQNL
jgi:aryl-alcohol dehydrogenase-like predicted oxidoreductase